MREKTIKIGRFEEMVGALSYHIKELKTDEKNFENNLQMIGAIFRENEDHIIL